MINLPTPKYFVTFSFEIVHTFPKNGPNNKKYLPLTCTPLKKIFGTIYALVQNEMPKILYTTP